jgi:hypothetical protein
MRAKRFTASGVTSRGRWQIRSIHTLVVTALVAAMLAVVSAPAKADHPDGDGPSSCNELNWGKIEGPINGEYWICEYVPALNDFIWRPIPPPRWNVAFGESTSQLGNHLHMTRSRTEQVYDGVHTGADDHSYRNGARWRTTHVAQSFLYYWDGFTWVGCGQTGQIQGSRSYVFAPTWGWGSACGENRWYAATGWTWQWTGSTWNGASAWSGHIWAPCLGCLTATRQAAPDVPPPLAVATAPDGTPDRLRLLPPSGKAPKYVRIHSV